MSHISTDNPIPWESIPFESCLNELGIPKPGKLLARDYEQTGKIPVIDQGKNFIAGWTNKDALAIRERLPFVVFGDHTRAFKFVDFPFALGADGTQLLKPAEKFNPRFFYYACLHLPLPNRGYNRHFTVLKEQSLPMPHKAEQEKIAAMLWKVQRAIEIQDKLIATARELKHSAMRQLFTRGLRGESQKETDIGSLPKSWEVRRVENCVSPFRFQREIQIPSSNYRKSGRFPIVDQGQSAIGGYTDDEAKAIHHDQPIIIFGDHTRALKFVDFPFALGADGTKPLLATRDFDARFLFYALSGLDIPSRGYNRHYRVFADMAIPRPELDEQREITAIIETIDRKISVHERKRTTLQELFKTLLHQLMTGQIRVADLDIDTKEVAA